MAYGPRLFSVSNLAGSQHSLDSEMAQGDHIDAEMDNSSGDVLDYVSGLCFLHVSNYLLICLQSLESVRRNRISNETSSETFE